MGCESGHRLFKILALDGYFCPLQGKKGDLEGSGELGVSTEHICFRKAGGSRRALDGYGEILLPSFSGKAWL